MTRWLLVISVSVILASCGTDVSTGTDVFDAPFPLVPADPEDAGNGALLEGLLEIDGPCAYVTNESGTRSLQVLPDNTIYDPVRQAIRSIDGQFLVDGDAVLSGGGESNMDQSSDELVQTWDDSCDSRNLWVSNGLQGQP